MILDSGSSRTVSCVLPAGRRLRLWMLFLLLLAPLVAVPACRAQLRETPATCMEQQCAYLDARLGAEERARDLIARMTLDEKIAQTMNHAPAIPRLGVEEYDWWSEGLHGVARNGAATNFPESIGLAATFDEPLMQRVAGVIGMEGRAKFNEAQRRGEHLRFAGLTFWSPNVNIFRDPRWGRGQETFGEDPYLAARLGVAYVRGLQGSDSEHLLLAATPKHFAVHSGPEAGRHAFNAVISPHDLEDTYLPAFRAAIVDGRAASIMCAYNAVEGKPACASSMLLDEILRQAWGFTGFVVSDCDAVVDVWRGHHFVADPVAASTVSLAAGTDLDCGSAYQALAPAIAKQQLDPALLDRALVRLFAARIRLGMLDAVPRSSYASLSMQDVETTASDALALQAARESMVLLKNDGILPLKNAKVRIAVIGPVADLLESIEGNYNGEPSHPVTPLAGMQQFFGASWIRYAPGAVLAEGTVIPVSADFLRTADSMHRPGLKAEFFAEDSFSGTPLAVRVDAHINFDWNRVSPASGISDRNFAVRWTGELLPPVVGDYLLSFRAMRRSTPFDPVLAPGTISAKKVRFRVFIDNRLVIDNAMPSPTWVLHATDLRPHAVRIEYDHSSEDRFCDFEWQPPAEALLQPAIRTAQASDVLVAFLGLSPNIEGEEMPLHSSEFEDGDRLAIALPKTQERLLQALVATHKPLIVVYVAGSQLVSEAATRHANALLMAWYPGQQGGRAIAETLGGLNNPSGRLPITFYKSLEDLPQFEDYSMRHRTYRYFEGDVLYPFGFGLSYSSFHYDPPRISRSLLHAGEEMQIRARVENVSATAGNEIAELYLVPPQGDGAPKIELEGFERVHLEAGEAKELLFHLDARQMSSVDLQGHRAVRAGKYRVFIGGQLPDPPVPGQEAVFAVEGEFALPR